MNDRFNPYYACRKINYFQSSGENADLGVDKCHYTDENAPVSRGCLVCTVCTVSNVFVTPLSKFRRFLRVYSRDNCLSHEDGII